MPTIYVKVWDENDREVIAPFTYGKNGKKRRKPDELKPKWWRKTLDSCLDLIVLMRNR